MYWLADTREKIKTDNPGISVTDLLKKAGELWKKVEDRSVWDAKAKEAKVVYEQAMKDYNASGEGKASSSQPSKSKEKLASKPSGKSAAKVVKPSAKPSPAKSPGDFQSKEYISTDDSSSASDSDKKKKTKAPAPNKKVVKKEDTDEDEEMSSASASSDASESD